MTKQDYVNAYYPAAVAACTGTPIFPILALAESAVESGWGGTQLAEKANNFFGVKAFADWEGARITMPTREYVNGKPVMTSAEFRSYTDPADSFRDYVAVVEESRYAAKGVEQAATPEEQILDIAAGGYSTSPTYASLVTSIIEELKPLVYAL